MSTVPAATRQEGTPAPLMGAGHAQSSDDHDLERYWRDCQKDGEHLLAVYRRVTMNRSFDQQQHALRAELSKYHDLAPRLREIIAAADQELLSMNRFSDQGRLQYAALLHYRTGLASLWDIVSPYLLGSTK